MNMVTFPRRLYEIYLTPNTKDSIVMKQVHLLKTWAKNIVQLIGQFLYAKPSIYRLCPFCAGYPEEYAMGIDERWLLSHGVRIVRNEKGIVAITENDCEAWSWPLVRVYITTDDDGQMVIDPNRKFYYEKDEWNHPGACLELGRDGIKKKRSLEFDPMSKR